VKTFLKYSAILIGTYLAVNYYTGSGAVIDKGSAGGVNLVKAFQGR
jgi:hypothetical protein